MIYNIIQRLLCFIMVFLSIFDFFYHFLSKNTGFFSVPVVKNVKFYFFILLRFSYLYFYDTFF